MKNIESLLQHELSQFCSGIDISVIALNLNIAGEIYSYNGGKSFVSASMIKIPIMLKLLDDVNKGKISLSSKAVVYSEDLADFSVVQEMYSTNKTYSIDELVTWMMIESDNTATNTLIRLLGMDNIQAYITKMGWRQTVLARKMLDYEAIKQGKNNYTSASDICRMLESIYNKTILTNELCDYAFGILKKQRTRDGLTRYICSNITFAGKSGSLDGINHDAGIFLTDKNAYILCVFISGSSDPEYNKKAIGRISLLAYNSFN